MLGTESDGITFNIMAAHYARKAKELSQGGATQFAMYAFFDAMERMALANIQVLDAKRSAREAYDNIVDYACRLETQLMELDAENANNDGLKLV